MRANTSTASQVEGGDPAPIPVLPGSSGGDRSSAPGGPGNWRLYAAALGAAVAFLLWACAASAQATNRTYLWDAVAAAQQPCSYHFYERAGTNWARLGSTSNVTFTVTNQTLSQEHTYSVTASNAASALESSNSTPHRIPAAAQTPAGLKTVALTYEVPLPATNASVIELSSDLIDWSKRRILINRGTNAGTLLLTWVDYPNEPQSFGRVRLQAAGK